MKSALGHAVRRLLVFSLAAWLIVFLVLFISAARAAACAALQPDQLASANWGSAERYDGLYASRILAAMISIDGRQTVDLDLVPVPKVDALYAMTVGEQVLIIRVRGTVLCAEEPIPRTTWEDAKRWVLPGAA